MKYRNQILFALSVLTALILVFSGCSEKSLKGSLKINEPPTVKWASVGGDSLNHVNPTLFWYSSDEDGVVLDRLYAVMTASAVDSMNGVNAVIQNFPSSVPWTIVHSDSATVPLIASSDTSVYIEQYVFIKVMDDDSLFSNIIYKVKARNNHRPTCYVVVPTAGTETSLRPDPQWCLPETTSTFQGVRVAWVGKDSIDVPGTIQPDFDWNVRLYGPFADSVSCDTLPAHLYVEYHNPNDPSNVWIRDKDKSLINLETGWYLLYARNRDDALTPSIPATGYLVIFEPTWIRHPELTKQILLANHSQYAANPGLTQGELLSVYADTVRNFYSHLVETYLTENGYPATDYDWIDYTVGRFNYTVTKADLYNHRMVIVIDTDMLDPLKESPSIQQTSPYEDYLDVNGMIWVIGRRTFDDPPNSGGVYNYGDPPQGKYPIANRYFNLSYGYAQALSLTDASFHQAEFVGATSIMSGFPNLAIDTAKTNLTSWVFNGNVYDYSRGLIGVDYVSRLDQSETIYRFSAINPDTSRFHNFPVAVRYDKGTYKTAYFTFPLFFIQQDQAMEATRQMLNWFFNRN